MINEKVDRKVEKLVKNKLDLLEDKIDYGEFLLAEEKYQSGFTHKAKVLYRELIAIMRELKGLEDADKNYKELKEAEAKVLEELKRELRLIEDFKTYVKSFDTMPLFKSLNKRQIEILYKMNVREFILEDSSSALLDTLAMLGDIEVSLNIREEKSTWRDKVHQIKGLRIKLK